jgi:hypothetical protein
MLPCCVCGHWPVEVHHLKRKADGTTYGGAQKAGDDETIPLCKFHHWNGSYCQDHGWSLKRFEDNFGNERDLLAATLARLNAESVA